MKTKTPPQSDANPFVYIVKTSEGELNYEGFRRYQPRTPGLLAVCRIEDADELWLLRDLRGLPFLMTMYRDVWDREPDVTEVYQFLGDRDPSSTPFPAKEKP